MSDTIEEAHPANKSNSPGKNERNKLHMEANDTKKDMLNKVEHMKASHHAPEGLLPITKADAKSYIEGQSDEYAFEDPEMTINAKVTMTGIVNDQQQSNTK
jgi:hypothetical protein